MAVEPLTPEQLRRDPGALLPAFQTTDDLPELTEVLGQERALSAIRLSAGMSHPGYNMFVMGPSGSGRHSIVQRLLQERATGAEAPADWVYVHNFATPHQPNAIRMPRGRGCDFRARMESLLEELQSSIPAVFESDEYRARRNVVQSNFEQRHEGAFEGLRSKAQENSIIMIQTPQGFAFAPVREGEVMRPEVFQKLPEDERKKIEDTIEELQKELQGIIEQLPRWDKERREMIRDLNREVANFAVSHAMEDVRTAFADLEECVAFLDTVQKDLIDNVDIFLTTEEGGGQRGMPFPAPDGASQKNEALRRYTVNVAVDNRKTEGAPVISENNPNLARLIGRVEHVAQMGALVTDFTLIKSGALHAANGGYLIIDAIKILTQPYAWDTLKRALRSREIRIESPYEMAGLASTISLDPEPIPLDVKVVLIGERQHYYLLSQYDPDFADLFKVVADFSEVVPWDKANVKQYVSLIGTIVRRESLRHLSRDAVARVLEQSARAADDSERLTLLVEPISDLLREADYWSRENGNGVIEPADIEQAVRSREHRADRIRERSFEAITRDIMLIDTDGGLSVLDLGNFRFGRPTRITARIGLGTGKVLDIEREVDLGGPLHSKGVLILAGYLNAVFGTDMPLSLSASLVFEQSYGGVDGDSASSTELYALLSAISGIPIRQSFAVTGSVNQYGEVQAIGGVNEKIEGFFDICSNRGLTGEQGVLIPVANTKHLMLRPDVVEAVRAGTFRIFPITRIEEGVELLTGMAAGDRDESGAYPEDTVYRQVAERLKALAEARRKFAPSSARGALSNDAG
jgi:predicted ATP-dependent protease